MAWTWRYERADSTPISDLPAETFDTRADAETWLGENWRVLRESGVDRVSLVDDDRVEYGPMSLYAE